MSNTPYTYFIKWSELGKSYYGVRFAKNCHPSDFWVTYFTSSKEVKRIRNQFGDPDVIMIHKVFDSINEARNFEHAVLKFLEVPKNRFWLNKANGKVPTNLGIKRSEEAKIKSSLSQKGRTFSEEHKKKLSDAKAGVKRGPRTPEEKLKISKGNMGKKRPHKEDTKKKISNTLAGMPKSAETREKISLAMSGITSSMKGTKWWVNEEGETTRSLSPPGEGWKRGMIWK